jgi:hypothetical protein
MSKSTAQFLPRLRLDPPTYNTTNNPQERHILDLATPHYQTETLEIDDRSVAGYYTNMTVERNTVP